MINDAHRRQRTGIVLASLGAVCWGLAGPIAQKLFYQGYSPEWLTGLKMTISGLLILSVLWVKDRKNMFTIWKNKKDALLLLIFSVVGMSSVQYMYFATVKASNSPTATIMQSLGTIIIVLWGIVAHHEMPRVVDVLSVVLALAGTWLLVTKGHLSHLAISPLALGLGILLGTCGAINTLMPNNLLERYSSLSVVGWSMLTGGIFLEFIHPVWRDVPKITGMNLLGIITIIIFGTALAYLCFLGSLNYISPTVAGLLDAFEPLTATILSVIFLHMFFNFWEILGGILVLSTVFILSWAKPKD